MFLAALVALTLISFSYAREETLFTSSVTYCEPPDSLLVQQFDVAYIAWNESVSFNITAASVDKNVSVSANLLLNTYGMIPANFSINLCDVLDGFLCPLPQYNFSGYDSLPLPQNLGVSNRIPGIAFKVPDLEAFTQLQLIEVGTGKVKACVQATLSNGWSMFQPAVQWTIGGIALLVFVIAAWRSLTADSLLTFRFVEMFNFYQTIASSAFLSLNYPSVYRSFALNFAWSLGLLPSDTIQTSIDNMRHLTGGTMPNSTDSSAIGLVNRKLSPYNFQTGLVSGYANMLGLDNSRLGTQLAASSQVQTVTDESSNVLQAGIPIFVNSLHIATANAFMTMFLYVLILLAIAVAAFALGYLFIYLMERYGWGDPERCVSLRYNYRSFFRAWFLRLCLISLFPTSIFVLYQWTLQDSWLSIFISVIFFVAILSCIGFSIYRTVRLARSSTPYALFSNPSVLASYGPLYAQYRIARYYYFVLVLSSTLLKAIFIAFVRASGLAQLILLLIIEAGGIASLFSLRPHRTKGSQAISIFLGIIRLVCLGLMIPFVVQLQVAAITRTIIGLVIAVILSVAVLVVILNLFITIVGDKLHGLWSKPEARSTTPHTDEAALEKGPEKGEDSASSRVTRPRNPTPDQNLILDPEVKQVYPASPTMTDLSTSASTNWGSVLLPRRWTFTPVSSTFDTHELDEGELVDDGTTTPRRGSALIHEPTQTTQTDPL